MDGANYCLQRAVGADWCGTASRMPCLRSSSRVEMVGWQSEFKGDGSGPRHTLPDLQSRQSKPIELPRGLLQPAAPDAAPVQASGVQRRGASCSVPAKASRRASGCRAVARHAHVVQTIDHLWLLLCENHHKRSLEGRVNAAKRRTADRAASIEAWLAASYDESQPLHAACACNGSRSSAAADGAGGSTDLTQEYLLR